MSSTDHQEIGEFHVVSTTLPTKEAAQNIARILVDARLAACVHILGPIESTYRWQGTVEVASEWTCQAKTRAGTFDRVCSTITKHHPYDVPEIIATRLEQISPTYAAWLNAQLETL